MKVLKWALCAVFIFLLQTQFSLLRNFLNITVVLVYFFGLKNLRNISAREYSSSRVELESASFGAAIGLTEDILSGSIIGPGLLSKGFIGFITPVVFTNLLFRWTPLWGTTMLVAFTALDGVLLAGSRVLFTGIHLSGISIVQLMLLQSLMNIPFGILLKP